MKNFFIYGGIAAAIAVVFFAPAPAVFASTNISASSLQHWAWNDKIGWIDFYSTGNVTVSATQLSGYASSSAGYVSLDCGTAPNGSGGTQNICSSNNGNYRVNNDGAGNLSGWAWNDTYGWISFYWGNVSANPLASSTALCQSYNGYCGVSINSSGAFQGWAWNDVVGWIDFNCTNLSCSPSTFSVATAWVAQAATGTLDSETFDTGDVNGAQMNSITWKGSAPAGTSVAFQIAVSNSSSGPWNFIGPDGTSATVYSGIAGTAIPLNNYAVLIGRYFRYRVILTTNTAQTVSPSVTSVIVNWSP